MFSHGAPGSRASRKRVGVCAAPQQTAKSFSWYEPSMCYQEEANNLETLSTADSSVALVANRELGRNFGPSMQNMVTGEGCIPQDFPVEGMSRLRKPKSAFGDLQCVEHLLIDAFQSHQNLESGGEAIVCDVVDAHLADGAGEAGDADFLPLESLLDILTEDSGTGLSISNQESLKVPVASPVQLMAEMLFTTPAPLEVKPSGVEHCSGIPLIFAPLPTEGSFRTGIRPHEVEEYEFLPPTSLSAAQTNNSVPDDDSWHSSSSVFCDGSEPDTSDFVMSLNPTISGCDDGHERRSANTISHGFANFADVPQFESLPRIDQDRPSQTNGSVLASAGDIMETINSKDEASRGIPGSSRQRVQTILRDQPSVVDLTEDSDDEEESLMAVEHLGHPGSLGKRRMRDYFESDCNKRKNTRPQDSLELGMESHNLMCQADWSKDHHSMDMDLRRTLQNSSSNQVAYSENFAGSSFHPPLEGFGVAARELALVAGRSGPFSAGHAQRMAGIPNSTQMSALYGLGSKRTAPMKEIINTPKPPLKGAPGVPREEATPPPGLLAVNLLKHQRIALAWMEKREHGINVQGGILADDQGLGKTVSTISLILKARAPIQKASVKPLDFSQVEAVTVELEDDEDQVKGSVPSDTVTVKENNNSSRPSTFVAERTGPDPKVIRKDVKSISSKCRPAAGTLVVCPTSVLRQWAHELKEKVTDEAGLSVLIYHGSNRTKDPFDLTKYDVVLSTYSIVSMEVPKQPLPEDNDKRSSGFGDLPAPFSGSSKAPKPKKAVESSKKGRGSGRGRFVEGENGCVDSGPLARVNWFRVVLDEAQSIKNSRTQVARATWGLRAKRRWCLSGTPIQNAIEDLYSYFRFFRYSPFDTYKVFQAKIKDPVTRNPAEGYKNLQKILFDQDHGVMLRRTKGCKIDGRPIVDLPARIVTLRQAEFSDEERSFYNVLESESQKQFQDYAAAGTLQHNYVNILWMLLRLRQACDHPLLVKGHQAMVPQTVALGSAWTLPFEKRQHLLGVLDNNRSICTICNDPPDDAVVCICCHVFCRQCITEQLATGDDSCCPIPKCRKVLKTSLIFNLSSLKNVESDDLCGRSSSNAQEGTQQDEGRFNFPKCIKQEECNLSEVVGWKSSSKIDAVIDTLRALPPVFLVVENGKVVAESSKDMHDVRLLDTSCVKIVRRERLSVSNLQSDFKAKHQSKEENSGSACTSQPVLSVTDNTQEKCPNSVKGEILESTQPAKLIKTEIAGKSPLATVSAIQPEPVSAEIVGIVEPLTRHFVESTEKAIVFSQWTSMLDLLEVKLKQSKFNYRRLDGTMSVLARDRAVSDFKTMPEVTVIIMSLKAASLGLNMVAACHVLLLDVWWNPTTEDQAIDRAHRIGQTRTVSVSRFTVKNTIEDRILQLQEKKRKMCASAFGETYTGGQSKLSGDDIRFLFQG